MKEKKELKVGDKVKVDISKYKNFRGTIVDIDENGLAIIEVSTYYGHGEVITAYKNVKELKKVIIDKRDF